MRALAKKIFAAISLAALLFMAACGSGAEKQTEARDASATSENAANQSAPELLYPDLEAKDFGGYEFTFLTRAANVPGWYSWEHRDIVAEEMNGEVLNDAVYARNLKIEEKYNIKITDAIAEFDQMTSKINQSVKAGDDIYDAVCMHVITFPPLAQAGNFLDLFEMPKIDLSKPWWNQGSTKDLSIINRLFIMQGDLLIMDNDAMEAMIFNKKLIQDYNLGSPYDIVKGGEWTFDKLIEMMKNASKDLNGDGQMIAEDDLFGCLVQADTDMSFLISGGEKICAKDENDIPVITFGSERCYRILEAVSELNLDGDNVVNLHRIAEARGPEVQVQMMEEDRALFSWIRMRTVEELRGMDTDFGIIPMPKLEKAQERYITHMNPHTGVGISILRTASDLERTGTVLEDLCAESKYTLQPAYYEINLSGKYVRDDESHEMLDIILSNTAHDIGYVYDFGGFGSTMIYFGMNKKTDYASTFEKSEQKMQIAIEKTIAAYENIN